MLDPLCLLPKSHMPRGGFRLPFQAAPWALTVTGGDWPGNWPPAQGILLALLTASCRRGLTGEVLSRQRRALQLSLEGEALSYLTNVTCMQLLKVKRVSWADACLRAGDIRYR